MSLFYPCVLACWAGLLRQFLCTRASSQSVTVCLVRWFLSKAAWMREAACVIFFTTRTWGLGRCGVVCVDQRREQHNDWPRPLRPVKNAQSSPHLPSTTVPSAVACDQVSATGGRGRLHGDLCGRCLCALVHLLQAHALAPPVSVRSCSSTALRSLPESLFGWVEKRLYGSGRIDKSGLDPLKRARGRGPSPPFLTPLRCSG